MYILCEITDDGVALCDGCGDTFPEAAADAVGNLTHGYDVEWPNICADDLVMWKFTKIYPEKKKYVPPLWKPSENYLNEVSQDGTNGFVSSQV